MSDAPPLWHVTQRDKNGTLLDCRFEVRDGDTVIAALSASEDRSTYERVEDLISKYARAKSDETWAALDRHRFAPVLSESTRLLNEAIEIVGRLAAP